MKSFKSIIIIIALLILVSCSNSDSTTSPEENLLIGNWKLVNVTMPAIPEAQEHTKKIGSILSLRHNNDFTLDDSTTVTTGEWYIGDGRLRLYIQNELLLNYNEYEITIEGLKLTYFWSDEESEFIYIYYEQYERI